MSKLKQPSSFFTRLPSLHGNACIHSRAPHLVAEVAREKIAAERRHRVVYPGVFARVVAPEVLM
jgi:hypothetical protein